MTHIIPTMKFRTSFINIQQGRSLYTLKKERGINLFLNTAPAGGGLLYT